MNSKEIQTLFTTIRNCPFYNLNKPPCNRIKKFIPVINTYTPEQKYMIISSDPSGDTNKELNGSTPHSDFALRFLSLIFTGTDSEVGTRKVLDRYSGFQRIFDKYFYWTHFSKCYTQGNPNNHCAKTYLLREIELFDPALIISLGNKPADFLLGKDKLANRVNQVLKCQDTPLIVSLHPSRDWNLSRRLQYSFDETWKLIRNTVEYSPEDSQRINILLNQ